MLSVLAEPELSPPLRGGGRLPLPSEAGRTRAVPTSVSAHALGTLAAALAVWAPVLTAGVYPCLVSEPTGADPDLPGLPVLRTPACPGPTAGLTDLSHPQVWVPSPRLGARCPELERGRSESQAALRSVLGERCGKNGLTGMRTTATLLTPRPLSHRRQESDGPGHSPALQEPSV